jgi:hypothetical protein
LSNWQPNSSSYPSPYGTPGTPPPSRGSSKLWLWMVLGVAGLSLFCCCGGGISVVMFGLNVASAEVADELRDNPKFREHIGELQTIKMDLARSAAADDEETFIYNVQGSKGSGVVTIKETTHADGEEEIVNASLRLPTGKQVQLIP